MTGIDLIARERMEQITKHGWTLDHDRECHPNGVLLDQAAALLLRTATVSCMNGRIIDHFDLVHKNKYDRIRQLQVAGALIAAEIDRLLAVTKEPPCRK